MQATKGSERNRNDFEARRCPAGVNEAEVDLVAVESMDLLG